MNTSILNEILGAIDAWGGVVRVTITHTLGSTPRKNGADMIVGPDDFTGTIGGGKLEFEALARARIFLKHGAVQDGTWPRETQNFVLGPELKQCCGGVVWMVLEYFDASHVATLNQLLIDQKPDSQLVHDLINWAPLSFEQPEDSDPEKWFVEPALRPMIPLVIYGAGHVGRALVRVMQDTPFSIIWVDTHAARFPNQVHPSINTVIQVTPADYVVQAPADAFHVVMTYSHQDDLDICRQVLDCAKPHYLGLIASKSKKAKFLNRLHQGGITPSALDVFHCPIGRHDWSNREPSIIAISIAAQLVDVLEHGIAIQDKDVTHRNIIKANIGGQYGE